MRKGESFEEVLVEMKFMFKDYSYGSQKRTWQNEEVRYLGIEAIQYEYVEKLEGENTIG